jgi:hypothetical protein
MSYSGQCVEYSLCPLPEELLLTNHQELMQKTPKCQYMSSKNNHQRTNNNMFIRSPKNYLKLSSQVRTCHFCEKNSVVDISPHLGTQTTIIFFGSRVKPDIAFHFHVVGSLAATTSASAVILQHPQSLGIIWMKTNLMLLLPPF